MDADVSEPLLQGQPVALVLLLQDLELRIDRGADLFHGRGQERDDADAGHVRDVTERVLVLGPRRVERVRQARLPREAVDRLGARLDRLRLDVAAAQRILQEGLDAPRELQVEAASLTVRGGGPLPVGGGFEDLGEVVCRHAHGAGGTSMIVTVPCRARRVRQAHRCLLDYRSGRTQMPRSCISRTCRSVTCSRYSACFMGARSRYRFLG